MEVAVPSQRFIAFWSYTHFDDEHDGQWLTNLRSALAAEVRALSGKKVEVFQDVEGIEWGEKWRDKLHTSAGAAVFLIPVITPSYFRSNASRSELEQFLEQEKSSEFRELILPVYYITCPELQDTFVKSTDWLAGKLEEHQYIDIRSFRHRTLDSYDALQMVKGLATGLTRRDERAHNTPISACKSASSGANDRHLARSI
jgi:cobaltochelatase CobT